MHAHNDIQNQFSKGTYNFILGLKNMQLNGSIGPTYSMTLTNRDKLEGSALLADPNRPAFQDNIYFVPRGGTRRVVLRLLLMRILVTLVIM